MSGPFSKEQLAALLEEIGRTHMPFGKFGPKSHPPAGAPIYDLPLEYLLWFRAKGFPRGRLGELLAIVCQAKADGTDVIFDALRRREGGRAPLRKKRIRAFKIEERGESESG